MSRPLAVPRMSACHKEVLPTTISATISRTTAAPFGPGPSSTPRFDAPSDIDRQMRSAHRGMMTLTISHDPTPYAMRSRSNLFPYLKEGRWIYYKSEMSLLFALFLD